MALIRYPAAATLLDAALDVSGVLAAARGLVEDGISNQPRSLQRWIGPSELGNPCDHCLAARLSDWEQVGDKAPWLPWVGTQVHAGIADAIERHNKRDVKQGVRPRFHVEQRVTVGDVGGHPVSGSTDLFDALTGTVIDWKIVGETKLREVKSKQSPGATYQAQAHLYGRGWANKGYAVNHVAIAFLPRNSVTGFSSGLIWHEPYDESLAVATLARADRIARNLEMTARIGRDREWVAGLPRAEGCWDCGRYADAPKDLPLPGRSPDPADPADPFGFNK